MPNDQTAADALLEMQRRGQAGNNDEQMRWEQEQANIQQANLNNAHSGLHTDGSGYGQQPPTQATDMPQLIAAMTQLMQQNAKLMGMVSQGQGNQLFNILPDLSHNIADFDGLSGAANAKIWLQQLESTATLHKWTEAVAFETARSHLTKAAKNWYIGNLDTIVNWQTFRKAFANTFLLEKPMTEKWKEMQGRCQRHDEKTVEYFFDKVRLCKALKLSLSETKMQVAVGLLSRSTSAAITNQSHFDLDDVLRTIEEQETLETARRLTFGQKQNSARPTADDRRKPTSGEKATSQRAEQQSTGQSNGGQRNSGAVTSADRECYRCHRKGHIARNCTVKREITCYNCHETGHISKDCKKPRSTADTTVRYLESDQANGGLKYHKQVKIGGVSNFNAFVDPGSSDCLIKASLVLDNGFEYIRAPSTLIGFGKSNNEVRSSCVIDEKVEVDSCIVDKVRLRVVPDDVLPCDVIVGRNFTENPSVTYFRIDDKLEFRPRENFEFAINPIAETDSEEKVKPEILEKMGISPAAVRFVRVKIDDDELKLPILNSSEKDVTLQMGEVLKSEVVLRESPPQLQSRMVPIAPNEVHVGPQVGEEQKDSLLQLLNKYRMCSAMNDLELGSTPLITMDIQEKPGSEPVCSKPYKASAEQRQIMKKIVREWKEAGLVTETDSEYASPCLLVLKADGTSRLVVDYRRLNKNTTRMNFPLPNIDDGLETISGATIFATLDLAQGYLQIPLTEDAKRKTAFITPDETGQFERAMFGLMNAPFYFAKLMKKVFDRYGNDLAVTFFDDILLHARSWEELLHKLEKVLQILKDARLTLNLKKCVFGADKVNFVGLELSKDGIGPGERKVRAILDFPTPCNVHEARRFHGMASFFRRFIPGFAREVGPIIESFKKDRTFVWGERQEVAFRSIKEKLASKPILAVYNRNAKRTELHTDASADGLAAMLFQSNEKDELHLVYAISRKTSETERAYHSSKLELLAIVWAMERLRPLLIGIRFVVITDCQALIYVNSLKTKNPQIIRWLSAIAEFDYEIQHRKGERMQHVDALSRAPVESVDEAQYIATVFNVRVHEDEILMYQRSDEKLARKIKILETPESERTKREKGEIRDYILKNGLLYKRDETQNGKELYVVPCAMRKSVVIKNHDLSSHFGVDRTLSRIREFVYFPNMKSYVRRHIASCVECILSKAKVGKQHGELHPIPPGKRPFAVVHVDHLGPFVTSARKNRYILAAICNLTKFAQLYAVRDVKSRSTVAKLERMVEMFGAPERLVSDRGTAFTSSTFKQFCDSHGIKHTLNSSRHAQANGLVERLNQTILPALQSSITDCDGLHWDKQLPKIERDINSSICKSTGRTPFEMLYGYIPRVREGLTRNLSLDAETYPIPEDIKREAIQKIEKEQIVAKERESKTLDLE